MSEATKNSRSPRPMTTGGPCRTAIIVSGSSALMIESAKMPRSSSMACARPFQNCAFLQILFDQVSNDFSVSFRYEFVIALAQPLF